MTDEEMINSVPVGVETRAYDDEKWITVTRDSTHASSGATREEAIREHLRFLEINDELRAKYPDIDWSEYMYEDHTLLGVYRETMHTTYVTETFEVELLNPDGTNLKAESRA